MMDTPEKSQIGTPVSKFEESPFSNFINSLSPIKPSKTIHISQTISSLSFTSPPSVFTSPHINLQKESRFVKRYQLAELAKHDFISDKEENKDVTMEGIDVPANCSDNSRDVGAGGEPSSRDSFAEAPQDIPDLLIDLPRELKYDCGSPSCETAPISGCEMKSEPDTFGCVSISEDEPCTRETFGTQRNLLDRENSTEGAGCDWDNMISETAADLLVFNSPGDPDIFKGLCEESVDAELNLLNSLLSQHSEDGNDQQQQLYLSDHGCVSSDVLFQSKDHIAQPEQGNKRKHIDQGQDNNGSFPFNESFNGEENENLENEPNMHRGIRRRCLVFEIPGARKNVNGGLISSSSHSFQGEATILSTNKPMNRRPLVGESSKCILPAIGLHLNAVASKDCRPSEKLSSEMLPVPLVKSCEPLPSPTTGPDTLEITAPDSLEKDGGIFDMEVQIGEEASQGSANAVNDDLTQNSPKKKRRRTESTGEDGACKRCNCKKSKCLKLYCECFAAGVYCVEPCSCQDCFNKPIHEDTVLATRKQIESRNPLAFAPKVIRNTDSVTDLGDDSNRTPASARHKRGCNCKKSSCLKKYCECYQGGVGCSISCRCEGCKNAFGRKDGSTSIGREIITEEDTQMEENSIVDKSSYDDEEMNPMTVLPKTPLRVFRSGVQIPTSSKGGKPPRMLGVSSSSALMHPCDVPGRSTYLRTQPKLDQKNIPSSIGTSGDDMPLLLQSHTSSPNGGIKTLSPNSKRISPPHHHQETSSQTPGLRSSRKLILQSIPSFPALTPRR